MLIIVFNYIGALLHCAINKVEDNGRDKVFNNELFWDFAIRHLNHNKLRALVKRNKCIHAPIKK